MKQVILLRSWRIWNKGETAAFEPHVADGLIRQGIAMDLTAGAAPVPATAEPVVVPAGGSSDQQAGPATGEGAAIPAEADAPAPAAAATEGAGDGTAAVPPAKEAKAKK